MDKPKLPAPLKVEGATSRQYVDHLNVMVIYLRELEKWHEWLISAEDQNMASEHPLARFLRTKLRETHRLDDSILLSWDAAHEIADELDQQDRRIEAMANGGDCK